MKTYIVVVYNKHKASIDNLYAFKDDANMRKKRIETRNNDKDVTVHVLTKSIKSLGTIKFVKDDKMIFLIPVKNTRKKRGK